MKIIRIIPEADGSLSPIQSWGPSFLPNDCAVWPDELDTTDYYAYNGFVILTVEVDQMMFARQIQPMSFVICALWSLLFALIMNGVMYLRLKKIDMIASLKNVE